MHAPRHSPRPPRRLAALAFLLVGCAAPPAQGPAPRQSPADAVDGLLAADRAFSDSSAAGELAVGLSRMFARDVLVLHAGGLIEGADSARAALAAAPTSAGARATWAPIRGGVSADGRHGFTYGYMTITRADGTTLPAKYVSYWTRGADGWRVAAYKRVPRPAGTVSDAMRPPALPARLVAAPAADAATVERYAAELRDAELAFSRDAAGGLAAAFRRYGAPDAANVGGPTDAAFRFGPDAIAEGIAAGGEPPSISWSAQHTIVASSGDLGVNVGFIELPPNGRVPFLTVWRRGGPGEPWRYVAE